MRKTANETDKYIGNRVRSRRLMLDMSQTQLGDAIGVAFQQVQKYEKGVNRMGAGRLEQVARVLNVPVTFFFDGAPNGGIGAHASTASSTTYVDDFIASRDGPALSKAFMNIRSYELQRSIVRLVERLAEPATADSPQESDRAVSQYRRYR